MTTTAEGVETDAQKAQLHALGCTEMQGWLFSAAKPAADIRAMLDDQCRRATVAA
jgi:EAL domain-containing protein (putative c-di-GMP-specific phosphodiesterase class I)